MFSDLVNELTIEERLSHAQLMVAVASVDGELVLEELDPSNVQPEPDTISYTTYKTEEIDCGGVNNFQHT